MTSADHEALILQLYEHVGTEAMEAMFAPWAQLFRSAGLHALLVDPRGEVLDATAIAFVDGQGSAPREYEEEWRNADPRMALAMNHLGTVLSDIEHIDPVAFERSDVYHAVMRPFDLRYSLFANIPLANGFVIAQAMMRSKAAGPYERAEVETMARLQPHVRRAFDLRLQLGALRGRVADLASALDMMPSPVFVLDECGRILHHNAGADAVLAAREGVSVRNQRLVAADAKTNAQLRVAVAQAIAFADRRTAARTEVSSPTLAVDVPRAGRRPLTLVVHPVRPRVVIRSRIEGRARALLVVHDADVRIRVDRSLLERLHGLTPTEAELAATLAEGKSVTEFAALRGCTEATARTHLKRVLDKTDTRRQAELVHRILATSALHAMRG